MEGSFGAGLFRKVHALFHRYSRIVPVNGHDEYYKGGTANNFALCTEKISVQRAFYVMHLRCIMQRRPFAEGKLSWDDVLTNVMHLRCIMQRRPFAEGKLSWDDVLQM